MNQILILKTVYTKDNIAKLKRYGIKVSTDLQQLDEPIKA
jgi:hypothetical protein